MLRAMVRLLHGPVAVSPLSLGQVMIADFVPQGFHKGQGFFIARSLDVRFPAGGVGPLVMDVGRRRTGIGGDTVADPLADVVQKALAGFSQVAG